MAQEDNNNKDKDKKTAIAIRYEMDKDRAPLIVASGKGVVADEILRIAQENRIPLHENPTLAQMLGKLQIDTPVPPELYVLVAQVLFFVYQLDRMAVKKEKLYKKMRKEIKK
ncbi:MAG: EscU/YscU/HrcU family type III secretion system export apparatus switch protein [Candidatus Margulisiibacteriota bacterium]